MLRYTAFRFFSLIVALTVFVSCKSGESELTTFYLLRHAEKAVDGTEDPDLSEAGRVRAERLAVMMKGRNITRLYSTDYKRTRQTVEPLASLLGIEIRIYDHRDADAVGKMIQDCRGKVAVVVGHSNSTPRLANTIIGRDSYQDLDESEYTRMWEIVIKGDLVEDKVLTY